MLTYRETSNISHTLVANKIVDHSDVVGASPVGAAPTKSSFTTQHLASSYSVKAATRQYENLLSVGIWCVLYQRLDGSANSTRGNNYCLQNGSHFVEAWMCSMNSHFTKTSYCEISYISRTLVGNKIVDNSDVNYIFIID